MGITETTIKDFFNIHIGDFLGKYGEIKEEIDEDITKISGNKFPGKEMREKTKISEFSALDQQLITYYEFEIHRKVCNLVLKLSFNDIQITDRIAAKNINFSSVKIDYSEKIVIGKLSASTELCIDKKENANITFEFADATLLFNIENIDVDTCLNALADKSIKLPEIIEDFWKDNSVNNNPLSVSLKYRYHENIVELRCKAEKPIGPDIFNINYISFIKNPEQPVDLSINFNSSHNDQILCKEHTVICSIDQKGFIIAGKVDLPELNVGKLIGKVNIFSEQVPTVEKEGWLVSIDLFKRIIEIDSPNFNKWLNISFCQLVEFSARNLKILSTGFENINFTTDGGLIVGGTDIVYGELSINKHNSDFVSKFIPKPDNQKIEITLGNDNTGSANFTLGEVMFGLKEGGIEEKQWTYKTGECSMNFDGLPEPLSLLNDKSISGILSGDKKSVAIQITKIDSIQTPVTLPIPITEFPVVNISKDKNPNVEKVKPADAYLTLVDFSLEIDKAAPKSLHGKFELYLPEAINKIFGLFEEHPYLKLFKTYSGDFKKLSDAEKNKSKIELNAEYTDKQFLFEPQNSPFAGFEFNISSDDTHILDLKEGKYEFTLPKLGYDTKNKVWIAKGNLGIVRMPEAIPMGIVKNFLNRCGIENVVKYIPDNLPILVPVDDNKTVFDVINPMLKKAGFGDIIENLKPFEKILENALKDYLKFTLPEKFIYTISYANGNFDLKLDFKAPDSGNITPLKVMYPSIVPSLFGPQPGIIALNIKSLSWGSLAGIPVMNLDADVNCIDFGSLIISEVLGRKPDDIGCKIELGNVFIVNPFTFPVPVFFDKLEFYYEGLEKMHLESQFKLPKPGMSLFDIASIIQAIYVYLTTDRALTKEMLPHDTELKFTIGKNFLVLPDYVSGTKFGYDNETTIDVTDVIVNLMNWCKTLQFDDLIKSIPRHYRELTNQEIGLNGLDLIKANGELIALDEANPEIKNRFSELSKLDNALIADISAKIGIHSIAELEAYIAMFCNLKKGSGFLTSFTGQLSKFLSIRLSGECLFTTQKPYIATSGNCILNSAGKDILKCGYSLKSNNIEIEGVLDAGFMKDIEAGVFNFVKSTISFDSIKSALSDVDKKTGIRDAKQEACKVAKVAFDEAKSTLGSAQKAFNSANGEVSRGQEKIEDLENELYKIKHKCDGLPICAKQLCEKGLQALLEPVQLALEAAKKSLEVAKKALSAAKLSLDAAKKTFSVAKQAFDLAKSALDLAQNELNIALNFVDLLKDKVGNKIFNLVKNVSSYGLTISNDDKVAIKGHVGNEAAGFTFVLSITVLGKSISLPDLSLDINNPINGTINSIGKAVVNKLK